MVIKILILLLLLCAPLLLLQRDTTATEKVTEVEFIDIQVDGYFFEKPSFEHPVLKQRITVILVSNKQEMERLYKEKTGHVYDPTGQKVVVAFSFPDPVGKSCVMYIPDPRVRYRPEFIGHELTHCIFGYWHPNQD